MLRIYFSSTHSTFLLIILYIATENSSCTKLYNYTNGGIIWVHIDGLVQVTPVP